MAISFVGSATGTNTATMPAHAAGDLIVVAAFNIGASVIPSLAAGWTNFTGGGNGSGATAIYRRIGFKIAASSSEVVGTWANATHLVVHVYRGAATLGVSSAPAAVADTTIGYFAVAPQNLATSWIMAVGVVANSTASTVETPPTGMTVRENNASGSGEIASFDTNGAYPSDWATQTVSLGGSYTRVGTVVEIKEAPNSHTLRPASYALSGADTPIIRPSPISFIGAATGTNTATLPAHQAGDLIVVSAWNAASNSAIALLSDYTNISNAASTSPNRYRRIMYKIAGSSGETIPAMANCTICSVSVYRGVHPVSPVGPVSSAGTVSTQATYTTVAVSDTGGGPWVFATAFVPASTTSNIETPPSRMVSRTSAIDATSEIALFDTDGGTTNWPTTTVALGASLAFNTVVFPILAPVNTNMVADPASYAIGAADVNIIRSYTITADPGSYMIGAADVALVRSLVMSGAPAAYAIGAANVTFEVGRFIIATPASYAIGAADVGFVRSMIMSGAAASYAISGADTAFVRSLVMSGAAASYAINAADVTLEKGYVIAATPASYGIGAADVGMVRSLIMSGHAAGYLIGGADVAIVRGYSIFADPASYVVSAAAVTFEIELSGFPMNVFRDGEWVLGRLKIYRDGVWEKPVVKRYHDGAWEEM